MDQEHEISAGELYKRPDGNFVMVLEVVGNAINYRLQSFPLLERPSEYWLRRDQFVETMDGPIS